MEQLTFVDADGVEVFARRWLPDDDVRANVLIVHGASEHSARYGRVADVLCGRGYAVSALDLRGHGPTAAATGVGRIGPRGMDGVIDDIATLADRARADAPGRPLVLFGHSLGSLVAQAYVERHGDEVDAYVLSGAIGVMEGA